MRGKILFAAGLGIGYVFGTRAGRERYESIKAAASKFFSDPKVRQRMDDAQDFVKDKAPEVAGFLADGAKKIATQVASRRAASKSSSAD